MSRQEKSALDKLLSKTEMKDDVDVGSQGDEAGTNRPTDYKDPAPIAGLQGEGENVPAADPIDNQPIPTLQGSSSDTGRRREAPGIITLIRYFTLRIVFVMSAMALIIGLYAYKLFGIYDPCETFVIVTENCIASSYMKGLLNHNSCTREYQCLLPGFWSAVKKEEWTF